MGQPLNEEETSSLWDAARAHGLAGKMELCLEVTKILRNELLDGAAPPRFMKENCIIRNEEVLRMITIKGCDDTIEAVKQLLGQQD